MIPSPTSTYHMAGIPYIFVNWRQEVCNLLILGKREHRTRRCEFGHKRLSWAWEATWWQAPIFGWEQSVGISGRAVSLPLSLFWPLSRQHHRPSSHHLPHLMGLRRPAGSWWAPGAACMAEKNAVRETPYCPSQPRLFMRPPSVSVAT